MAKIYRFCSKQFDEGQIVTLRALDRNEERGQYVVITSVEPANWRGDERDVYEHIQSWYTARPATEEEAAVAIRYFESARAWAEVVRSLGNPQIASVDEAGIHTTTLRMLDSYDDRFDGSSKTIPLSQEQRAAYDTYQQAFASYREAAKSIRESD